MMHMEAYAVVNALFGVVCLLLGARMAGLPVPGRTELWMSAAGVGALSLMPLLSPMPAPATLVGMPASVCLCYRERGGSARVRACLMTLCASMLLGGAGGLLLRLRLSAWQAAALSLALGLGLCPLLRLLPTALMDVRQVELSHRGQHVLLPAMLDSGNLLRDPVSYDPVLVVSRRALQALFPSWDALDSLDCLPRGFRLLSVRTAAGSALMPMFRPERCRLYLNGSAVDIRATVAVAPREYAGVQALVPLSALPERGRLA